MREPTARSFGSPRERFQAVARVGYMRDALGEVDGGGGGGGSWQAALSCKQAAETLSEGACFF